jgi:outer membrane protein TolC
LPAEQEIELVGAVEHEVMPVAAETELVDFALEHRADLIAAQHEAERAEKQVPLVRRERIPNVTLSGNYSRFEDDNFAGGDLGFYVPVLRSSEPELLDALAERDRAKLQLDDLRRTVAREVRQARRACIAAGEDLETTRTEILPRSRGNYDLERARFARAEVGAAELIGMFIDAQEAEKEYLDAVQAYNDACTELQRIIGVDS